MGSHRVGHGWSGLAAAAAACVVVPHHALRNQLQEEPSLFPCVILGLKAYGSHAVCQSSADRFGVDWDYIQSILESDCHKTLDYDGMKPKNHA